MGELPGCNSIPKSTSLCGGSPDSSSGKHPHIRKPLEVDPSLISPHPLRQGSLVNPSIVPDTWTHILYGAKYRACPPLKYNTSTVLRVGGNSPALTIDNNPVNCQPIHP